MNPRRICLTYLGWCPGVEAASKFIPDKELSQRQDLTIKALVTTATLACATIIILTITNMVPRYGIENIQFNIITDKASYTLGEEIKACAEVANPHDYSVNYPSLLSISISTSINGKPLDKGGIVYLTPVHETSTVKPHTSYTLAPFANVTLAPTERGDFVLTYIIQGVKFTQSVNKTIQIR